jgi:hypothetical protein
MNRFLMKSDQLKTFAALLEGLLKEKAALESRLADITKALGGFVSGGAAPAAAVVVKGKRGRKPRAAAVEAPAAPAAKTKGKPGRKRASNSASLKDTVIAVLKEKKSLGRKELLEAVKATGYNFTASDPLNSLSTLIYSNRKIFAAKSGIISLAS